MISEPDLFDKISLENIFTQLNNIPIPNEELTMKTNISIDPLMKKTNDISIDPLMKKKKKKNTLKSYKDKKSDLFDFKKAKTILLPATTTTLKLIPLENENKPTDPRTAEIINNPINIAAFKDIQDEEIQVGNIFINDMDKLEEINKELLLQKIKVKESYEKVIQICTKKNKLLQTFVSMKQS